MSTSTLLQEIKEARRDALVGFYIANHVPQGLTSKITDADSLYEYLLLDTKISDLVQTSPVAEAISSVQLFINRCVEGDEGTLTAAGRSHFAEGKFLYNWDTYNQRYATWAGKERLKYYAGSYIDPILRFNKTDPFLNMEQSISQGRLTDDIVRNALQGYLTEYEALADLEYISVNKGDDESILFFVGRTRTIPYEYYWRRLILKRNDNNKLVPDIWSQWKKITASISEAVDNYVVPYWENNRLHIEWMAEEKMQFSNGESPEVVFYHNWFLNSSGSWKQLRRELAYPVTSQPGHPLSDYTTQVDNKFIFDHPDIQGTITYNYPYFTCYFTKNTLNTNFPDMQFNLIRFPLNVVTQIRRTHPATYLWNTNIQTAADGDILFNVRTEILNLHNTYGSITNNQYTPPSGSQIDGSFALSLSNNIDFSNLLNNGFTSLFSYNIQQEVGGTTAFSGPYGLYLWEIFFHIPFLAGVRFLAEQRYTQGEKWLKFIFDSTGYSDANGNLITDQYGNVRYWNVVPLQEDTEWNDTLSLATTDPDVIALADPMQYKLAVFIHTLDYLISRGDSAYRMLERDTMSEAKMYYIQASQLLGPRPYFRINNSWPNPTLEKEADAMTVQPTRNLKNTTPIASLRMFLMGENGNFLPPYNYDLLSFWDKIELRLYNLRHNLSLDGQPLSLPLFAEPVDPQELQYQYGTGDGMSGSLGSGQQTQSSYRFPIVIEKAKAAVSNVIQFGSSLQNALEKQDAEMMTLLFQTQQQTVINQTRRIHESNLSSLQASLESVQTAKIGAESDKNHFVGLLENWMSQGEIRALELRTDAAIVNGISIIPLGITGGLDTAPNVFGLANGGSRWGAISNAVAQGLQVAANVMDQTANIMDISESYRRRREDWTLQRDIADNQITQLESQIISVQEQITMAQRQIALTEIEYANTLAVYELQNTRFTSQALYNWMVGRLTSFYYQMYDATLPLCLMARASLDKELGGHKAAGLFTLPAWNDLYQGLLAGEMLMVELQKLDNIWMEENSRGMEVVKTASFDTIIRKDNEENSFVSLVQKVLSGSASESVNGVSVQMQNNIFSATLNLAQLGLDSSYNQMEKDRKIKNLSVTLPALLGPYQDIEATLTLGGETVALSNGMDDSGLFVTDFNDSRFLPFEGMDATSGILTLSIFHTGQDGSQRALLESLNDIIISIRYVIR